MSESNEVEDVMLRLLEAWSRRDAGAFCGLFAEDADYVTGDGQWLKGRPAIRGLVESPGPMARVAVLGRPSIRTWDGGASVVFRWAASNSALIRAGGVASCVLERTHDGWRIQRLQNTDERADA
jgi:ketosteroid isomerase-like protein